MCYVLFSDSVTVLAVNKFSSEKSLFRPFCLLVDSVVSQLSVSETFCCPDWCCRHRVQCRHVCVGSHLVLPVLGVFVHSVKLYSFQLYFFFNSKILKRM